MQTAAGRTGRPIPYLRWWICGLLFASTVINYIDRQTLSVLAPYLKEDYGWNNTDFAKIVIAFRLAYAIGQSVCGRLMDRVGTRRGLTISVLWYSAAAMLTSLASGLRSFCVFRFLLGIGESANWPAATKAVSEWFPSRERAWAVALFDSGSSIGAAVAPGLVLWLYHGFGGPKPAFILTGTLGLAWLLAWRWLYRPPEEHGRIAASELELILSDRERREDSGSGPRPSWLELLKFPQTWGTIASRALTDPIWFFITDWFAIYLVAKGFKLEDSLIAFWIPFIGSDLGNFAGGGVSSWLVGRGWPVGRARKAVVIPGAIGMASLMAALWASNLYVIAGLFGLSTFSYAAFSTMANTFPADLFPSESVATVSGMSGTGAGIGTILSTFLIGYISDRYSFAPVLIGASLVPLLAMALVLLLVRNTAESGRGRVRAI
ncbi:MAG TPA: MFS transporter [Bryobacteraceae bacterium]|nr:MFS transporter [Bryobacteraceae bacterium]